MPAPTAARRREAEPAPTAARRRSTTPSRCASASRSARGLQRTPSARRPPRRSDGDAQTSGVSVFVRMRPARDGEQTEGDAMRALKLLDNRTVYLKDRYVEERPMVFSKAFNAEATQESIFEAVGAPAVDAALAGRNGTVLVYGQTGTGKTYTAFGTEPGREGLALRCARALFAKAATDLMMEYRLGVQYVQIYNDILSDLLCPPDRPATEALSVREDSEQGTYISGARHTVVTSAEDAIELFEQGSGNRAVRLTTLNAQSSRSHGLFIITVRKAKRLAGPGESAAAGEVCGKLTLVDLAGSERIKRTRATGAQRNEAQCINRSLASLGNVIHALADPQARHVPYRDSKLTRLLQDSLGEYGSASIVITFSPCLIDIPETLTSLQFGQRALCVKQTHRGPRLQVDLKALARQLQQKVRALTLRESELVAKVSRLEEENARVKQTADGDEELIDDMHLHIRQCASKVEQLERALRERTAERDELQDRLEEASAGRPVGGGRSRAASEARSQARDDPSWEEEDRAATLLCHAAEISKLRSVIERLESDGAKREEELKSSHSRVLAERDGLADDNARLREHLEAVARAPVPAAAAAWGVVPPPAPAAEDAQSDETATASSSSEIGGEEEERPPSPAPAPAAVVESRSSSAGISDSASSKQPPAPPSPVPRQRRAKEAPLEPPQRSASCTSSFADADSFGGDGTSPRIAGPPVVRHDPARPVPAFLSVLRSAPDGMGVAPPPRRPHAAGLRTPVP
eukprot:TRINITY_DN15759_c0_g2_i1.p1 TRINITY_DN15759_c0_g2~~TRINITY_DN15759_c0_g2_i1.p1  ORF type:complete len:767 (+),score=274.89 TRINITY_DN15759_c0_g2_i1:49-2301(+)